jgi:basic membrane protein A
MKKIAIISVIIFTVIIAGIFFITDSDKGKEDNKKVKVGFILNGKVDDGSWGESHYIGMEKCEENLDIDVTYKECVPETKECMAIIEELIEDGCEIIFCNSISYGKWEKKMADKYPQICFFHATGTEKGKNFSSYFGRIYQVRYLSGIVAGLQTKTNKIGYVAAYDIPEVVRGINAFTLGVRKVNKKAKVYVDWCESWVSDEAAVDSTKRLIKKQDIDVLTIHTDSLKPLEIAEKKGIWTIGYNIDNSDKFPKTFLTAPIWEWNNFYEPRIKECIHNKFYGDVYWEGIDTGIIALADYTDNVKDGIAEVVKKEQDKISDGTYDVFYGPIKDNKGKVRVKKGESMSDDVMLNEFDWFVEGVVINEK